MPAYGQAAFLGRAVGSLFAQTCPDWELVVVDDGSPDDTRAALRPFLSDPRVRCHRLPDNRGLGAALNVGLGLARAPLVAYLPCDDLVHPDHLAALLAVLANERIVLAWSGVRHHSGLTSQAGPEGHGLQLVQVMHRRTPDRWRERDDVESDDLEELFWNALRARGGAAGTGRVTCVWTDHPGQRHKAIRERHDGGLNVFRHRYRVRQPLRFHSRDSGLVDEVALYRRFREWRPPRADGLRIVLVGELSFHPERVLALVERGARLYGLWTSDGLGSNAVGPMPFGHVTDLPRDDWRAALRRLRPDLLYAQLNWRAVPFAHEVLDAAGGVPFVWHFKESPQLSIARGEWGQLAALCARAHAVIFSSPEEREWFHLALPGRLDAERTHVLDGSLPKADWFAGEPAPRLSSVDGEPHTVVLGRPLGLDPDLLDALRAHHVHVHFHGLSDGPGPQGQWRSWLGTALRRGAGYVHVHAAVDQRGWLPVLSRYDAGWTHLFTSHNDGDLRRATWDDLNCPARIGTLMAAGLPMLHRRSPGSTVAVARLVERLGIGLLYEDVEDLCAQLHEPSQVRAARDAVSAHRHRFTFDHHADALLALFERLAGG
ncbi:Glycosyltransferase involved in cell wall bisynthesis [Streptoalloteichus tenebrarius]|uniref:Glycosyltransferase involved in cell wall bisynthesis n=1 Tax=Streptoalloteichus tenebrarius (strain ATCC 17920 / DSM 40477 / JCM 4838 / CBS 697.72 / NBRC 16177 / NCIMB 11028 / NRRL B-12390 / A12253. 1 / ISP 5477) TaxID=1933 RepID=A0ABT1HP37_STRSD|nr:Glycosyltransferase involved in cell wall bisynthesis [Streptoalloteichus tenebrarius]BFF04182.1 hypothetical protein GCM10020241_58570 [Streptoalloteichus tenebrarius]